MLPRRFNEILMPYTALTDIVVDSRQFVPR